MAETIRWRRLVLESAAVVGSILLAFAIDAAWDLRQELAEERELLLGLRQELAENQSIMTQSRAEMLEALGLLQDFLGGPPDESTTEPSTEAWGQIYLPMVRDWTGSFTTGFVDAATSSGRLALIQNPEVAASIARFRQALEDVDHMADRLGLISVRASEVLGRFRPADAAFVTSSNPWSIDPRMARTFFQDREVTGLASARAVYYMGYLFVLESLEARTGEALELVDADDHWPFLLNDVPAVWFHTGLHPDYHTPDDDPERIEYERMTRIVRLVYQTSWDVANADARPDIEGMRSRPPS